MIWSTAAHYRYSSHAIEAARSAARAESKADRHSDDLHQLKKDVARLTLACQSMWELLRDNTDFKESDLEAKMLEVDLRDGQADGKIGMQIIQCPSCKKTPILNAPTA